MCADVAQTVEQGNTIHPQSPVQVRPSVARVKSQKHATNTPKRGITVCWQSRSSRGFFPFTHIDDPGQHRSKPLKKHITYLPIGDVRKSGGVTGDGSSSAS